MDKVLKAGPSGYVGGSVFSDDNTPQGSIKKITVFGKRYVDGIQITYSLGGGTQTGRINGLHGQNPSTARKVDFVLDDDEYIIGVRGKSGKYIDSIQFITNKQHSPTYGGPGGGLAFEYNLPDDYEVVGFFGRAHRYIDAVGIIYSKR